MMYGQMTAGSWIYIGTQGILQGTYETFAEAARQHFGGTLRGHGHADRRPGRDGRRPAAGRDHERGRVPGHRGRRGARPSTARDRLRRPADPRPGRGAGLGARGGRAGGEAVSIALVGNAAEIEPAWAAAGERFDLVTDQTSAHDALGGYVPAEISLDDAAALRDDPAGGLRGPRPCVDGRPRPGDARLPAGRGGRLRLRQQPARPGPGGRGRRTRSTTRASCPAFIRPQFCEGRGPFRWVALSGDPADIRRTDEAILELFPDDAGLRRWMAMAQERVPFQGLPARICWLGYGERAQGRAGLQRARPDRARSAPRSSSAATISTAARWPRPTARPRRWRDGSDAVADWPLLNALVNTAAGASWVSLHHGGGVGHRLLPARRAWSSSPTGRRWRPRSSSASSRPTRRWASCATSTPATSAPIEVARERGVHVPMLDAEDAPSRGLTGR